MAEETIQKYKRRYAKTTSDAVSHAQDIDEDTDVFTDDWNLDIPSSTDNGKFVQVDYANKKFVYSSIDLSGYATETWVEEQGYVFTSDVNEWTGDNTFIYSVTFGGYYNGQGYNGEIYFRFDQQATARKVMYSDGHSLNFATQFGAGSSYSPTNVSDMIFRVEGKMYYTHNQTGTPPAEDEIATKGDISGGGGSTLYKHSLTLTAGSKPFKMEFISESSTAISSYAIFDSYYKSGALKLGTYVNGGKQNYAGLVFFDWDDEEYRIAYYEGDSKVWQYTGYITAFSDTVTEL